jgi:aryl-alcohol dehydrogenase-like predicted oxidoreductase
VQYKSLGDTELIVSAIGFGAWGIGGNTGGSIAYGATNPTESLGALAAAYDVGINFFDTAAFYGFGESERLIGAAFRGRRDKVIIASKAGMLSANGDQDFSPKYLNASLDETLKNIDSDYLDLFQLHSPPASLFDEGDSTFAALEKMKSNGRIREWGISARSPTDAMEAISKRTPRCVQINLNLSDQRARSSGLLDLAKNNSIGLIVRTPLSFGFLTGKYDPDQKFEDSDHRSKWKPEQKKLWASAVERFASLIAATPGQSAAQFALRFCLSFASVSTVIPGMLNASHVRENSVAGDMDPLSPAELSEAVSIYESCEFFMK